MALINITGATVGITTAHPSRAPEFTPVIDLVRALLISYCLCLFTCYNACICQFFYMLWQRVCLYKYICKTQIDVQPLIDVQSSNLGPISTSQTSVSSTYVLFQILKSTSNSQIYVLFTNSQIGIQFLYLWQFLTFSNRRPMTSLTYALTLTLSNKLAIDLKIWKGRRFDNTHKSDSDLR